MMPILADAAPSSRQAAALERPRVRDRDAIELSRGGPTGGESAGGWNPCGDRPVVIPQSFVSEVARGRRLADMVAGPGQNQARLATPRTDQVDAVGNFPCFPAAVIAIGFEVRDFDRIA